VDLKKPSLLGRVSGPAKVLAVLATCGLLGSLTANQTMATTIASDSFAYTVPTELNGKSGGSGWSGPWTAVTSDTEVVDLTGGTPLRYSTGTWLLDGGNQALQITGASNQGNLAYRSLASSHGDDAWISFLVRWEAGVVNNNDFLVFWFDNVASGYHTDVPNIGIKGNEAGAGPEDFVVRLRLGPNDDYAGAITPPETSNAHLVVGHLYKTGSSTNYNAFEMWVDPTMTDRVGDRSASNFVYAIDDTGNTSLASFDMLGMRSANLDSGDVILIDELRLGDTMLDVVSGGVGGAPPLVPEPVTMAGLVLGIGALGGYVRRRR